jgi:hypothetical protein
VLGGGIRVYGWVTILLYCLWLNEHIHFSNSPLILVLYVDDLFVTGDAEAHCWVQEGAHFKSSR